MKVEDINLRELIENETGLKFNRANKMCCPVHKEKTPSFSVDVKRNKFHCFGCGIGGDAIDFIKETKGLNYSEACRYLGVEVNEEYKVIVEEEEKIRDFIKWQLSLEDYQGWNLVKIYRFEDEENKTLYFTGKFSTPGKKEIRYYHINEEGKVKFGRGDKEPVPYNYARLKSAIEKNRSVFIVEGEKDADTIAHLGYVATSLKGIKTIDASIFQDAIVNFIGDTGQAGEEYKKHIYYSIADKVQSFRIIELPGLEKLGDNADVTDWLKAGHTKEEFKAAIRDFWDWKVSTKWKYVTTDSKGNIKPLKVWENLNILLERNGIKLKYNLISKEVESYGRFTSSRNELLTDIRGLAEKNGFKLSKDDACDFINKIAIQNKYNPFTEYLHENEINDTDITVIDDVFNCLIINKDFSEMKPFYKTLFVKWLLNVVRIAHNELEKGYGSEGVLVLQGNQGIRKTTFFRELIRNERWFKDGLNIDPKNKDSVSKATKYILSELGELDSTLKGDLASLKAFLTSSTDEFRRPYERVEEKHPRITSFCATVNKLGFLKDETGDRRYWVIPVERCDIEKLKTLDIDRFWGAVYSVYKAGNVKHWLEDEEKENLYKNNLSFKAENSVTIAIKETFNLEQDKAFWKVYGLKEICELLDVKFSEKSSSVRNAFENLGFKYTTHRHKYDNKPHRGFKIPNPKEEEVRGLIKEMEDCPF